MDNRPQVRYSPTGKGKEFFERLKQDRRIRVIPVRDTDQDLEYEGNVCAWINYDGREFAIGRPNEKGFLHDLSRALRMQINYPRVA